MKRCLAANYIPRTVMAADASYLYGFASGQLYRYAVSDVNTELTAKNFSGGVIAQIFTTDLAGEVFVDYYTGTLGSTDQHVISRSTDYGVTFTDVYTFAQVQTSMLTRTFAVGYPSGVRTYAMVEYYTNTGTMVPLKILASTNGISWTTVATIDGGDPGVGGKIRHFHAIRWNTYNSKWYITTGDAALTGGIPTQCMLMCTADLSLITNSTPANLALVSGLTVKYNKMRYRGVDIVFDSTYVYMGSDQDYDPQQYETGIWRWKHDLTDETKVDIGYQRYEDGTYSATPAGRANCWSGLVGESHVMWITDSNRYEAGKQHLELYMASTTASGSGQWREAARWPQRDASVQSANAAGQTNGLFSYAYGGVTYYGVSCSRGAGKGVQGETAIWTLGGTFKDDFFEVAPGLMPTYARNIDYIPDVLSPCWWVDSANGSDSNDGTTPSRAWRTIEKALKGGVPGGSITISNITEAAGVATLDTATAHGLVVGDRFTIVGETPAAYNRTWYVRTRPSTTQITFFCVSGTGNQTVAGTLNSGYSNVGYGSKVILSAGTHIISDSFDLNVSRFPTSDPTGFSLFGFEGEAAQVMLSGQGAGVTIVTNTSSPSLNYLYRLNTANDWLIRENLTMYEVKSNGSPRVSEATAATAKDWARDCTIGIVSQVACAFRNATTNAAVHRYFRCTMTNDGTTSLLPAILVDCNGAGGIAQIELYSCLVLGVYRGIYLNAVGAGLKMYGSSVLLYTQKGVESVNANNTAVWDMWGNCFISGNGTAVTLESGSGTFANATVGQRTEYNFYERTPARAKDQSATNVDMQVLGTALTAYYVGGDPRNGAVSGSRVVDRAPVTTTTDFNSAIRKDLSTMGHLEYQAGAIVVVAPAVVVPAVVS